MQEEWIPIVMFVSLAAVLIVVFWLRFRAREAMQQTIRLALDKGHELTPDIIDRLGHPKRPQNKDLRLGIIWLAVAIGLGAFGLILGEEDAVRPLLGTAGFPAVIGIAYLILHRFARAEN